MKRIYLDTCVILSYLQKDDDRFEAIKSVLENAKRKSSKTKLFTSTITVVEITRLSKDGALVTPDEFEIIEKFWLSYPVTQVDLNPHCASHGRQVMQKRLIHARGPELPMVQTRVRDLAHLGTAIWLGVDEYWTYDGDFGKYPHEKLTIRQPYVDQLRLPGT